MRSLIDNNKFTQAKRELSQWEKTGEDRSELLKLAAYFRKHQVRSLIDNNKFTQAKRELNQWEKVGEDRQEFWKLAAYFRKHQVRSLIDNNKFPEAKRELSQWEKTGEDRSGLLKMTTYFNKKEAPHRPGTVFDRSTGLMWQNEIDSQGSNWQTAKSHCAGLTLGNFSDWELPSKDILAKMIDKKEIFDSPSHLRYWSSTPGFLSSNAWAVHFGEGTVLSLFKSDYYYVRCIRGVN